MRLFKEQIRDIDDFKEEEELEEEEKSKDKEIKAINRGGKKAGRNR